MFVKDLNDCEIFTAGDGTILRELLHPGKADLKLRYSLAYAVLPVGLTSLPHRLKTSEVYYILKGQGLMSINEETAQVFPGQAVYIPPDAIQFIKSTGDQPLEFLCIVDPAWRREDEEVFDASFNNQ
ncbi:MAG TPA: cupin domain-containing protein [Bacteroidales bacterium]|nr:cupin domain-containing protein [Bacteroidales bacterium]HRZ48840.1 cupin domain-containing protein [Bacteroidales bacterium]